MEQFVDYMLTKHGMADALPAILAAHDGLRAHSRQALHEAMNAPDRRRPVRGAFCVPTSIQATSSWRSVASP